MTNTQNLTRQQKRALARQKHHTEVQEGSYYRLKEGSTLNMAKHHILNVPLFTILRIFSVTPDRITGVSAYGPKNVMPVSHLEAHYEPVPFETIQFEWMRQLKEAETVKGKSVSIDAIREEIKAKQILVNPEIEPVLEAIESEEDAGISPIRLVDSK